MKESHKRKIKYSSKEEEEEEEKTYSIIIFKKGLNIVNKIYKGKKYPHMPV